MIFTLITIIQDSGLGIFIDIDRRYHPVLFHVTLPPGACFPGSHRSAAAEPDPQDFADIWRIGFQSNRAFVADAAGRKRIG